MTMQSSNLLPALQELPGGESGQHRSFRDHITNLVHMDRAMYAAEFASAASFGMWGIFDGVNVDDSLTSAYEAQYPRLAADQSLHEQWQDMMGRGPDSMGGFINGLKGKAAEFNVEETLEQNGFTNVEIAPDPTQPVWDITATGPDGQDILIQVKTGAAGYAGQVEDLMVDNPDIHFAVSSEIYESIADSAPELISQMTDMGPDYDRVAGIEDGLNTLSGNMGIDIPDGLGDLLPYAGVLIAAARLIYSVLQTEKEFKAADRTTRNKIQVVQTLTLMSRMGVATVLATAGGMGGTAAGSLLPGIGNLVGGIVGSAGGAGMGMYLNRHLQPHMLNLALDITGLTNDDLFYYKNKPRIDTVAVNFQRTARELAAAPA